MRRWDIHGLYSLNRGARAAPRHHGDRRMRGSLDRDVSKVSMSTQRELQGIGLAAYLVAWSLFLVVAYLCCTLAVSWSLTP